MLYGYCRVSSKEQNLARQIAALEAAGIEKRNIITDKASGKDFNRKGYNSLVGTEETTALLREGDCLMIYSIDRLGRNYDEIQKEWKRITQDLGCDIAVLDMPILDTRTEGRTDGRTLDSKFVADLVLQILSYVAEKERTNIKARQRQGLDVMERKEDVNGVTKAFSSKTGRATGRPAISKPDNFDEVLAEVKAGKITATEGMKRTGLKRNSWYKLAANAI